MSEQDGLLAALFAGVTRDDAFEVALGLITARFRGVAGALVFVDPTRPEGDIISGYGLLTREIQQRYKEEYAALDPAPAAMARLPVGTATTTQRLWGAAVEDSRFYKEFYRPLGMVETLGGPFINDGARFGLVAVQRGLDREPFDEDEIAAFERLMPHVAQAVEMRSTFFQLQAKAAALETSIEPIASGIMIFSSDGVLTHANRAARDIVAAEDGLILDRRGRLRAADPQIDQRLTGLLSPQSEATPATTTLSAPRQAGPPLALRVTTRPESVSRLRVDGARAIVLISVPDRGPTDPTRLLMDIFGLTAPSAQLVVALLDGYDLAAYAKKAGRSVNTAKFHLKAAFAATGTRRQIDLIRAVNAVVRDLGAG